MRPEHDQPNYANVRDSDGTMRDLLNDNSRDGSKLRTKASVGFEMDFSPTTIEEEIYDGGWNRIQRPVGAEPQDVSTSGGRGEGDNKDFDTADNHGMYAGY